MSRDEELEKLKKRKLAEYQRRFTQKPRIQQTPTPKKEPTNDEILRGAFADRAPEVWNKAKEQFPKVIIQIETVLADAIKTGKIAGKIDGASLAQFLRSIGLRVRLDTQIRYAEHGELKTLEQKLRKEE